MNVKGTKSFYEWQSAQADTQNMSLAEKLLRIHKRNRVDDGSSKASKVKHNCLFLKLTGYETRP